jgi:sugar (pentulose or hexulose) kinase
LHDSSAALIPYLVNFHEPFVLISTGTWCITLNPFNQTPLTPEELDQDCLCYMSYRGRPVKASRLFAGNEHEVQVKKLAGHFQQSLDFYRTVEFNPEIIRRLKGKQEFFENDTRTLIKESLFGKRDLSQFASYEEAYHQLILDIITQQYASTGLVLKDVETKRIFVDGGFSKNSIYMNLLASVFPGMEVYAASVAQATSMGTALAIHKAWNQQTLPNDIIELKNYSITHDAVL